MTTAYRALTALAGLSLAEAGEYLGVALDTSKSWSMGRNPTPQWAIDALCDLIERQEQAADEALQVIHDLADQHGWPESVDIHVSDDWPADGARAAVAARIIAGLPAGQAFRIS
ncbi:MAG: hypothetical protein D6773_08495 [Alphaproteobacteria bacterium]|nr:MAG: hypothetical protein D6773_08495 [Alphaproteobacteria bacterium]